MCGTGELEWLERPLRPATERVLHENTVFFVDALFGHRNFSVWKRRTAGYTESRTKHNSHMVVIQRRPLTNPPRRFRTNYGPRAMHTGWKWEGGDGEV